MKLFAGPCVIENHYDPINIANAVKDIALRHDYEFIFKASLDKANRTRLDSFRGIGWSSAANALQGIQRDRGIPCITDIHTADQAYIGEWLEWLQIPAFLCRQTDLLQAVGSMNRPTLLKKGQFMSPEAMVHAVEKIGHEDVYVVERGTSFGYGLVVDASSITRMKNLGLKVVMDCTHSVQQPNQGAVTGGDPELIESMAKHGTVMGADGLFFEVHPDPPSAKCDSESMLRLDRLEGILKKCKHIRRACR